MNEQTKDQVNEDIHQDSAKKGASGDAQADAQTDLQSEQSEKADQEPHIVTTDWQDKYLRLYAEFDNFRRRTQRERLATVQNAGREMMEAFLPVLDDFDRALKAHADSLDSGATSGKNSGQDALAEGLELVHQKFRSAMEAKGLKPMDAVGKPFDTDHHEAVTQIPAPTPEQVGTVIEVCERGYFLHDAVLRFAKVVVGK